MPRKKAQAGEAAADTDDPQTQQQKQQKDAESRKASVKRALKTNPENVFVIGPPHDNWGDNGGLLAGYLGFAGTMEQFRQWLLGKGEPQTTSERTHKLLENYIAIRAGGYGKTMGTADKGKDDSGRNLGTKQIWHALNDLAYQRLCRPTITLPLKSDCGFTPGESSYALAVTIAAMSFLVFNNPTLFTASHAVDKSPDSCVAETGVVAEDFHRAFAMLKFYYRQSSAAKKEGGFFVKDQTKTKVRVPEYFSPTEAEALECGQIDEVEGDPDGRTPGDVINEMYQEIATADIPDVRPLQDAAAYAEFVEEQATEWETAIDAADKQARRKDPSIGSAGRTAKRTRLSRRQLRQACHQIGRSCKVKHDDPSMDDPAVAQATPLEETADSEQREQVQGIVSRGINFGDSGADIYIDKMMDNMNPVEQEQYWKTQNSVSTVSAPTLTYKAACEELGYDPVRPCPFPKLWQRRQAEMERRRQREAAEKDQRPEAEQDGAEAEEEGPVALQARLPDVLELNGWQVTGVAWALKQESLPIRGGIIADDCGTGKTIIMLTTILHSARRARVQASQGGTGPWKPTIVIAPPHVVDVWIEEVVRFFSSELTIWRFYETKDRVTNSTMKDRTLPSTTTRLLEWLDNNCPSDDPQTCSKIIVSAYDTFMIRTLEEKPSGKTKVAPVPTLVVDEDSLDLDDEILDEDGSRTKKLDPAKEYFSRFNGRFGRVVLDEAHKIRNPDTKIAESIRQLLPQTTDNDLAGLVVHMLTATPMMNRGSDFVGYLTMFWREVFRVDPDESFGDFAFDPYDDAHVPERTAAYLEGGLLDYAKNRLPLWRLLPQTFWATMNRKDADGLCLRAYEVLRAVIPVIMLRRTQATVMEVNGEYIRIGDKIPPYRICTVELDWNDEMQFLQYKKLFEDYVKYLTSGQAAGRGALNFSVPGSGRGDNAIKGNAGTRSFRVHRVLAIMTFNMGLHKLLLRTRTANLVSHVHKWYEYFADKGMSHYFDLTRPERDLPLYADRFTFAMYLCKESPKLKYLAKLMGEICLHETDPRRALIFTDGPMTLWNVEGFLLNLGFSVAALRSNLDGSERKQIIDDFNSDHGILHGLVMNIKSSNSGLNLHHHCSDIIIVCVADNVNQNLQVVGRVHRIGQERVQRIWIVTLDHSYDQILQSQQTNKMLQQIAGEGDIHINESEFEIDERALAEELDTLTTEGDRVRKESQLRDLVATQKDTAIRRQSNRIITRILGQRCPRDRWGDHDLTKKDAAEEKVATPAKVRTVPVNLSPIPMNPVVGSASTNPRKRKRTEEEEAAFELQLAKSKERRRIQQQEESRRMAERRDELNRQALIEHEQREKEVREKRSAAAQLVQQQAAEQQLKVQRQSARLQQSAAKKAKQQANRERKRKGGRKPKSKQKILSKETVSDDDEGNSLSDPPSHLDTSDDNGTGDG